MPIQALNRFDDNARKLWNTVATRFGADIVPDRKIVIVGAPGLEEPEPEPEPVPWYVVLFALAIYIAWFFLVAAVIMLIYNMGIAKAMGWPQIPYWVVVGFVIIAAFLVHLL